MWWGRNVQLKYVWVGLSLKGRVSTSWRTNEQFLSELPMAKEDGIGGNEGGKDELLQTTTFFFE